jgi:hypothetical protein
MKRNVTTKKIHSRQLQPPLRVDDGQLIKALILKGLDAFEEPFRRKYPRASLEAVRNHMTKYLCERTRFEYEHPRRSFRYGRSN